MCALFFATRPPACVNPNLRPKRALCLLERYPDEMVMRTFLYFPPSCFSNCSNLGGNFVLSFGCQNLEISRMGCVMVVGL